MFNYDVGTEALPSLYYHYTTYCQRQCVMYGCASCKHGAMSTMKTREFTHNYVQFYSTDYAKVLLLILN